MPIVRVILILLALASPALAQDGARNAAIAGEAAKAFRVYIDGVAKKGERPDMSRPEISALFNRVFDLATLNALPPPKADDISWLMEWMEAANTINKLLMRYGSGSADRPDLEAVQRNMTEYEDQYAAMMNFIIRGQAREAVSAKLFMAGLAPADRTSVREKGYAGARSSMADFLLMAICSTIESGGKPENARLVAAAIRDTREVWASFFLPKDRVRVIEQLAALSSQLPDETARTDLAAFTTSLRAAN